MAVQTIPDRAEPPRSRTVEAAPKRPQQLARLGAAVWRVLEQDTAVCVGARHSGAEAGLGGGGGEKGESWVEG